MKTFIAILLVLNALFFVYFMLNQTYILAILCGISVIFLVPTLQSLEEG